MHRNFVRRLRWRFKKSFLYFFLKSIPITLLMLKDKLAGKKIIMFHISSPGHKQFIFPIYSELNRKSKKLSYYAALDYTMNNKRDEIDFPASHFIQAKLAVYLFLTDVFIQPEIYGRGPKNAIRIFIGHGQPNKITNWSDENLKSFNIYFLYGELERKMFAYVIRNQLESIKHIKLYNIGYPKLDAQIKGLYNREKILTKLGLNPNIKTIIYAPAWDPGGALRTLGTKVVEKLLEIDNVNVIIKLHPASVEPENSPNYDFYTGRVNWEKEFRKLEANHNFRYVSDYVINPILFSSDLMVTDFSGVALEFIILDRPVIYIDCPEFYEKTLKQWGSDTEVSRNDERFNSGRNIGVVVKNLDEMKNEVIRSLNYPEENSEKRKALSKKFLYNPGKASEVAANTILSLLK